MLQDGYSSLSRCCSFIFVALVTVLGSLLLVPIPAYAEPGTERTDLLTRQQALSQKLASLKAEQEFLVFKRAFLETDSKYLVLDLAAEKGTLMYRNRVLRTFRLIRLNRRGREPQSGIVEMTGKTDGSRKRELLFGDVFSIQGKKRNERYGKHPVYGLGIKDLAALFYALDVGSKAFIK